MSNENGINKESGAQKIPDIKLNDLPEALTEEDMKDISGGRKRGRTPPPPPPTHRTRPMA